MKRVIVIGMGFGGLQAAKGLAGKGFDVLALDRRNYHLFQPLLYQVATATLNQEAIAHPIRSLLHGHKNVRFELADVERIDLENKKVKTATEEIPYDYLVVGVGSVTNFFGMESVKEHAFDLKQLNDAVALRNHVLSVFERASRETDRATRDALMTFVVVGGGPTGVEFAGALSELAHHILKKDFPDLNLDKARIIMVEAMDKVLAPFPESLQKYTIAKLQSKGVEVRLNTALKNATATSVTLADGSEIAAHTLFWAAGVQAAPLAGAFMVNDAAGDGEKIAQTRGGKIAVQPDLTLPGHPEVFIIGDMMALEQDGKMLPGVAPVAIQSGTYAAKAIVAKERGKALKPFRYFDKGSMAVIGRYTAVARSGAFKMKGFTAWVAWLGLHLLYLAGFRNRLLTLLSWAYDYVLFDRQVRLITDDDASNQLPTPNHPPSTKQKHALGVR